MRIECPSCQAAYKVPDTLIGGGRTVRCARCGNEWAPGGPVTAPEPIVAAPPPAPPPPEPRHLPHLPATLVAPEREGARPLEPVPAPKRARSGWAPALIGWLATIVILAGAGWAAYTYRDAVMLTWPPSMRVYDALGLAAPAAPPPGHPTPAPAPVPAPAPAPAPARPAPK